MIKRYLIIFSALFISLCVAPAFAERGDQPDMAEYLRRIEEQRRIAAEKAQNAALGEATNYENSATNGNQSTLDPSKQIISTPSSNQSANLSSGSNGSAGNVAQMVGQGLQSKGTSMMGSCCGRPGGSSCCNQGRAMLGLGILAMIQSAMNKQASFDHSGIGDFSYSGSTGNLPSGSKTSPFGSDGSSNPFAPSVKSQVKKLQENGLKYNSKSGTLSYPGLKDVALSDLTNKSAMAQTGMSSAQFDKMMGEVAAMEKNAADGVEKVGAHTDVQGFNSGSGSSSSRGVSSTEEGASSEQFGIAHRPGLNDPKPNVAGMMKNYNGEMIGVAGDGIFSMMTRRYQQKNREEAFLSPDSVPSH